MKDQIEAILERYSNTSYTKSLAVADIMLLIQTDSYSHNDLQRINFWQRLKTFVENVQVNDMPSEEEKSMIIHICDKQSNKS